MLIVYSQRIARLEQEYNNCRKMDKFTVAGEHILS